MNYYNNFGHNVDKHPKWDLLENLYNKNIIYSGSDIIPKKIHFIWLGGDVPQKYMENFIEWEKNLPNYELILWTDDKLNDIKLECQTLFNNTINYGAKSDILRYEILNQIGGIYVDLDFLFIKAFDDLLHLDFFAGNGHVKRPEVFNSIMASKPNSKHISEIVNRLKTKNKIENTINGVMYGTGPYFITNTFFDVVDDNDNVIIFPTKYFFPFPAVERHLSKEFNNTNYIKGFINNNTYCIHLWHTSWQA